MADQTPQRRRAAMALAALVKAGEKVREPWKKIRDEVWQYAYDPTYSFLYQDWESRNGELFFKAKIPKAAQFIEVCGPYLYQNNPTYTFDSERDTDPLSWDDRRLEIERRYLAWAPKRGDQYTHCRRAVDDALCGGRGVVWTGYNQRRTCVQHVFDSASNLIDDPDARNVQERNLVMRERLKPKWELANLFPAMRAQIMELPKAGNLPSGMVAVDSGGKASQVVRYYEAWMRIPLSNYAQSIAGDAQMDAEQVKYTFTKDGVLLDVSDWEIPWWKDDLWPCSTLDFRFTPNSLYGTSPLETSLGLIRALNWSHTLILSKLQISTRLAFAIMNTSGQKADLNNILKMVSGEHYDIAVFNQVGNEFPEIGKMIQQLDIKSGVEQLAPLNTMLENQIDRTSGLYSILFAGETPTQLRTAEDATLKDRNSKTRIEDMGTQVKKFGTECGQKMRYAARYLEGADDIGRLFGAEAGKVWGEIAAPEEVAANRQKRSQVFSMATKEALQQEQQQAQELAAHLPPPGTVLPAGAPVPPPLPSPEQMQAQAQAYGHQMADQLAPDNLVDFEHWMLDTSVSVESGSMRRRDIEQEIDIFDAAGNQLVPTLMQSPNPAVQAIGLRITARGFQVKGAPPDLVDDIKEAAELVANTPMPQPSTGAA